MIFLGTPDTPEGHYLIASKDLKAGETIISEYPMVAGPVYTKSKPVCLQCLKKLTKPSDVINCARCKAPLCSVQCSNGQWHAMECGIFKESGFEFDIQNWDDDCPVYSCITVLRGLLVEQENPEHWKIIQSFMDHDHERAKKDPPFWKAQEQYVFNFINDTLGLKHIDQKAVRRIIGVFRTNIVKVESKAGYGEGVALYPVYPLANHNCMCNTYTRKHKDFKMDLVAHTDINKGDQVWTRYTLPQLGNFHRVEQIQKTWHFTCNCSRCNDPTEFGTMMSGLICGPQCPGILLPLRSNFVGSPWGCNTCKKKLGVLAIQKIVKDVVEQIEAKKNSSNTDLINLIDDLAGSILHPNHYLLIGIKEMLLQRLMWSINIKTIYTGLKNEDKIKNLELRTKLFGEVVDVLVLVDSPGADIQWKKKLEKMKYDEEERKAKIKLEIIEGDKIIDSNDVIAYDDTKVI